MIILLSLVQFMLGGLAGYSFCNYLKHKKNIEILQIIKEENEALQKKSRCINKNDTDAVLKMNDEVMHAEGMLRCFALINNFTKKK